MSNASEKSQPTSTDDLNARLKHSQIVSLSKQWNLPSGWESYFAVSGRGMRVACPLCPWKPGTEVWPWQRWKVLANHMAVAHADGHGLKTAVLPAKLQRVK
jgi:hypothetical protein